MSRAVCYVLLGVLITLCVGKLSNMEYQDAKDRDSRYCSMVRDGTWPDYDGLYAKMCRKYVV